MGSARLATVASLSIVVMLSGAKLAGVEATTAFRGPSSPHSENVAVTESVRDQLIRMHKMTGLALVGVRKNKIYEVDLEQRSVKEVRTFYAGSADAWGAISNRGNEVAFTIDMRPGRPQPASNEPGCPGSMCLGIANLDGSNLRAYPGIGAGGACWSHDDSKLVLISRNLKENPGSLQGLQILNLDSKVMHQIAGIETFSTSQCWSPDDNQIVYTVNKVPDIQITRIYDVLHQQTLEIGRGGRGTWSPDGRRIAVLNCPPSLHNCAYELANPVNGRRKRLFITPAGQTPLWWSPDGRFVAYVSPIGRAEERANATPSQIDRLRVRRLEDNSEDWVLNLADTDALEFQWTTDRVLTKP